MGRLGEAKNNADIEHNVGDTSRAINKPDVKLDAG